eukprot:2590784-Pleurochrysis_carterae.AAC.1
MRAKVETCVLPTVRACVRALICWFVHITHVRDDAHEYDTCAPASTHTPAGVRTPARTHMAASKSLPASSGTPGSMRTFAITRNIKHAVSRDHAQPARRLKIPYIPPIPCGFASTVRTCTVKMQPTPKT